MYRVVWLPVFLFTLLCTLVFMATCPGCPGLPFSNAFELSRHIRTCGNFLAALEPEPASGVAAAYGGGGGGGDDGGGGGGGGPMDLSQDCGYDSGGDCGYSGEDFAASDGIDVAAAGGGGGGGGGGAAPDPLVLAGEPYEATVVELLAALGGAPLDDSDGESVGPVPPFGAAGGGGGAAALPVPVLPSATLRAGSAESADFNTLAWLMKPGISASVQLYGMLQKLGVSGNGFDTVRAWLYKNIKLISDAVTADKLFTSDTTRGHIATLLALQGIKPPSAVPLILSGDGFDGAAQFSAASCDVMGHLRQHLLNRSHPSPPLQSPAFVHLFSGQGGDIVDNMANSKAGRIFNDSLQRAWVQKEGDLWKDPVRARIEKEYPGSNHHLHVVFACAFGDGFAAGEGLHTGFFQMRLKLGTANPALAHLTSSYLMAGVAETATMSERASDATKMRFHDLHAETWAKLGWGHFFDDKYVALSHEEVSHMGFASAPGDIHVFKLALLGLLLDNGEVRSVARTHNCLICDEINTVQVVFGAAVPPIAPCPRCALVHAAPPPGTQRYDMALYFYNIINHYKPGGLVEAASPVPLTPAEVHSHKKQVSTAMESLTRLGFTALCSTPAISKTWIPEKQLQWFAWGGGIPGLCGQPLMTFMFDLLHTVELGWEKYVMAYCIVSVQRSRGTNVKGSVSHLGGAAQQVFDTLIKRVPSFRDGVHEFKSFWATGISRKAGAFFTAKSYSAIMGPMAACLSPDVIPETERRKILILILEHVELFFCVARAPTAQWGGIAGVSAELQQIAGVIKKGIDAAFHLQEFKSGGEHDMDTYKLHMLLPSHLKHFLEWYGPLWDQSTGTAEACGRILKKLYLSTNRHAIDACRQMAVRFNENHLTDIILPRLLAQSAAGGGASAGAAVLGGLPVPPPQPPATHAAVVPPSTSSLHGDLAVAPISPASFSSAWAAARAMGSPLPTASDGASIVTWSGQAKLTRSCSLKRVCDTKVDKSSVVLQYKPRDGHTHGVRADHDHAYQEVKTALILRPSAFFSACPKSDPTATPRDFCLAQAYAPLTAETPRSLEYTLHKPRELDPRWVIVPVSELSHPLRAYPYYENGPLRPWTKDKKDVPVRESQPKANTVLVSTLLRW